MNRPVLVDDAGVPTLAGMRAGFLAHEAEAAETAKCSWCGGVDCACCDECEGKCREAVVADDDHEFVDAERDS